MRIPREQPDLEVAPFQAKLRYPVERRFFDGKLRTDATLRGQRFFSVPRAGLNLLCDVQVCTTQDAIGPAQATQARLASCESEHRISQKRRIPMSEINKNVVRRLFEEVWNK